MIKKEYWVKPAVNNCTLSVITNPMPLGSFKYSEAAKKIARRMRDSLKSAGAKPPVYLNSTYQGHPAVTRSVVEGLEKLGELYNYNPVSLKQLSQNVVVLSGISALRQMIVLKQKGYIRRLIAGPNMFLDPSDYRELFSSPEIDLYITHAPVCSLIERCIPALRGRCVAWAAGVDCEYWHPSERRATNKVIVYNKQAKGKTDDLQKYIEELKRRRYDVVVIEYGNYTPDQFRDLLHESVLLIGFTRDETQGIAWSEAWAADVPTFFWKNNEPTYLGVRYDGDTAPYLTPQTGLFFSGIDDFKIIMDNWSSGKYNFSARKWCLQHMSDQVCAADLVKIVYSI